MPLHSELRELGPDIGTAEKLIRFQRRINHPEFTLMGSTGPVWRCVVQHTLSGDAIRAKICPENPDIETSSTR